MKAIRLPYPMPETPTSTLAPWQASATAQWNVMRSTGWLIDFPDRHVSYALFSFDKANQSLYADELKKAVALQTPGQEPEQLEIRISSQIA